MATLVDSYSIATSDNDNYTAYAGVYIYYGQAFTSTGGRLYSAKFNLKKQGTLTGNLTAYLFAHTGTFGTSSLGTGAVLATSDTKVADSTLTTSYQQIEFLFTGANRYQMTNGTKYCIVVHYAGGDVNNRVIIGNINTSPSHGGQLVRRLTTDSWDNEAVDCCFEVYKLSGTSGAPMQDNMNAIAGTTGLSVQDAANSLAGTTGYSIQEALRTAYGGTGSTQDIINQEVNDGTQYSIQDGLGKL